MGMKEKYEEQQQAIKAGISPQIAKEEKPQTVDDGVMPQKQRKNIQQYINAISHLIEFTVKYEEPDKQEKKPIEELIPPAYHKYLKVFSEQAANQLPKRKAWDHKIDMKPSFIPKSSEIYPLNPKEERLTKEFIDEHLAKGTIQKSTSPQASPFFFVDKKDGKKQPCQDYRYVNGGTIKNAYPLPLVSDLLDNLKGAKYFTKFDMQWGYNNMDICIRTHTGVITPRLSSRSLLPDFGVS